MTKKQSEVQESDRDHAPEPTKTEESAKKSYAAIVSSATETDPSKVQESDQKKDSDDHEPEASEEKPNATRVSALDMILKSLSQISVFTKELAKFQETEHTTTEDEIVVQPLQLRDFLVSNIRLTDPMEANSACEMLVTIMELLRLMGPQVPVSSYFEVCETGNRNCNRCKMNTEYPVERSCGLLMDASTIREFKAAFKDLTFENILKMIKMNLKMPCDKEGCLKRSYVQQTINKLPSVFTIALEWENNETDAEMLLTTSFLATEIDLSSIYLYRGQCPDTKYRLVSMVCLHGDVYNCVAYENNKWVKHFGSEKEVIGDWGSVVNIFVTQKILPEILLFENVKGRD